MDWGVLGPAGCHVGATLMCMLCPAAQAALKDRCHTACRTSPSVYTTRPTFHTMPAPAASSGCFKPCNRRPHHYVNREDASPAAAC